MHVLVCEHPPTITRSRRALKNSNLLSSESNLAKEGIHLCDTDRGGDITFHGPGQIIFYPILDLNKLSLKLDSYLRKLEQVTINSLKDFNIEGIVDSSATGVWVKKDKERLEKICAIGIRASRWVSMHGFALNVNTNLNYFNHIIPCGLKGRPVTSMKKVLQKKVNIDRVKKVLIKQFEDMILKMI